MARYNPGWTWRTLHNDHFTIYYPEGYEAFAGRVLSLTDEVHTDISGYLDTSPENCPIVLNPGTDIFNGFYAPFPNRISLYETPYYSLRGFGPVSDSMDAVFTHEYAHFTHITTKLGWYGKLSPLLGSGSTITNILSPGWIIEGITTNTETLFTDGGRGLCSYFKGKMMSFSEGEGLWNLSAAGTYPPYQPPADRFYLSGYFMVNYLNRTYGDDAFTRLSHYQAMHPLGLSADALLHVTHKSSDLFYKEFLTDYYHQAQEFKDQAKSEILPQGKVVLSRDMADIKAQFWSDTDTIIAYQTGYNQKNAFVEINPFNGEIIREIEPGTVNDLDRMTRVKDSSHIVFAGSYPKLFGGGDLVDTDITEFDLNTRKFKRVTKGAHFFSADMSRATSQYVAARRNGMWIDLVVMDEENNIFPLVSKPGYFFESPVWSPDESSIACVVKTGANADIALVDPLTGKLNTLFKPDRFEDNDPCYSPDGTWLVFSSNRSGVWNIFAWDLIKGKLYQLTSEYYGATCPQISPDGQTLSFLTLYRGTRRLCTLPFEPVKGLKYYVEEGNKPENPDLERLNPGLSMTPGDISYKDVYKPFLHIPYFMSNEDETLAGIWVLGGDPVGLNSYSAFVNYGFDSKHVGCDLSLTNRSFWPDLMVRVYDKASQVTNSSKEVWVQERGLDLAMGVDMINRVIPDNITSSAILGTRFKWLEGLTDKSYYNKSFNEARSFFSELHLERKPDAPKRDMLPTWGQSAILIYEKTSHDLGSELNARNSILSVSQYLPSFIDHHGLEVKAVVQKQWGELSYNKDYSLPRGYSTTDSAGDLNKNKNLLLSLEYHFPINFMDKGLGLSTLHFNLLKGTVFADWGAGWDGSFSGSEWTENARTVVGGSIRAKTTLFSMVPLEMGLEAGYKTDEKEGFANLILLFPF